MKTDRSIADEFLRVKAKQVEAEKAEAEKADELIKEVLGQKLKEVEAEAKESDFPVNTTKPMIPLREETRGRKPLPRIICPFCENERKQNGARLHIEDTHGVPGVAVQDLVDVQNGVKSLEDLVNEKFDDGAEINLRGLSPRVSKEVFGSWDDIEDEVEKVEAKVDNPGRKVEIKEPVKEESEYEFTNPDLPFPFNLLRRRKARKK